MSSRTVVHLAALAACVLAAATQAATPPAGSVNGTSTETTWQGAIKLPTGKATCAGPSDPVCDNYTLTIGDPGVPFQVTITLDPSAGDWDTQLYDASGALVDDSANNPTVPEIMQVSTPGTYTVAAAPFAPNPLISYVARAKLVVDATLPPPAPTTAPVPAFLTYAPPGLTESDPDYARYAPTRGAPGIGASAGEPTLGIPHVNNRILQETDPDLSRIMFLAWLQTLRLEVDTSTSPAIGTWTDKSCLSHVTSVDPILHVDPVSGRTISTQLSAKRSLICLSNDDGDNWLDSPQGAGVNAGVDHQTVGAGAFPASDTLRQPDPLDPASTYPTATYYASQDAALAQTGLSRDGGFSWGVSVPMWNITQCDGLHGHVQVGPDGAVYVPNGNCPLGQSGFARSTDAGSTWTVHGVPGTTTDDDPGMAVGRGDELPGGRVYFGACQNGRATATSSDDRGNTFRPLVDIGAAHGVKACSFATAVAGDDDRAAIAFLGSTTAGGASGGDDPAAYDGVWYLYVAVTYDGGASWSTANATPGDPVQRGPICQNGLDCAGYRNLLDFNDIQLDEKGRVYVGYSDGCIGNCLKAAPNSLTDYTRIARQQDGTRGLYAAFDAELAPTGAVAPKTPYVDAVRFSAGQVDVTWTEPYAGNAAITEYRVYRRDSNGSYGAAAVATVGGGTRGYVDTAVLPGTDYCYQVRAVNTAGVSASDFEACASAAAPPVVIGDACVAPGQQLGDDRSGEPADSTPVGLKRLFAGEPFLGDAAACATPSAQKVELNVDTGAALLPGNAVVLIWNRQTGAKPSQIAAAQPDDRSLVSVRMVGNTPQCHFGHVTGSSTTDPLPSHGYDIGPAFPATDCIVRADGSLTVRVPTAVIDDGVVGPGYSFGGLEARSFAAQPMATATTPLPVLQNSSADFLVATNFALAGNDACRPDFEPIAVDDRIATDMRSPVTFAPMANDSNGGDCDAIRVSAVGNGRYGTTKLGANNTITYTPTRKSACTDEFSYTLSDTHGNTDLGVVLVKSTKPNCKND